MMRGVLAWLTVFCLLGVFSERALARPAATGPVGHGLQLAAQDADDETGDDSDEPDVAPGDDDEGEPADGTPATPPASPRRNHPPAPSSPTPGQDDSE